MIANVHPNYTFIMETGTKEIVENLIKEIRNKIPFNHSFDGYCEGRCDVCPQKLIEFLDMETSHWETRLRHNVFPSCQEAEKLADDYKKVRVMLEKIGFIKD